MIRSGRVIRRMLSKNTTLYSVATEPSSVNEVRYEKIRVFMEGLNLDDDITVMANKGLSTGLDVILHHSGILHKRAAIGIMTPTAVPEHSMFAKAASSLPEEPVPIDLNEALTTNCNLKVLGFQMSSTVSDEDYKEVNQAYWRTCTMVLSEVLHQAFDSKFMPSNIEVLPYKPEDGCFGLTFKLDSDEAEEMIQNWTPGQLDLKNFTLTARKIIQNEVLKLTGTNSYCLKESTIAMDGPCVQSLDLIGPFAVTACSRINDSKFLLQGISLPKEFEINHFLFGRIEANARKIPHRFKKKYKIESADNLTLSTLSNIGKKKSYVYKQWQGEYNPKTELIDLSDNEPKLKAIEMEKFIKTRSQPENKFNLAAEQHSLTKEWSKQKYIFPITGKQKTHFRDLWAQPKFKNTVGQTKEPRDFD